MSTAPSGPPDQSDPPSDEERTRIANLLLRAIHANDVAATRLALARGADIDARSLPLGWRPLHTAVINSAAQALAFLLAEGAQVDAADDKAQTPLETAARSGKFDLADQLLAHGADLQRLDAERNNYLHRLANHYREHLTRRAESESPGPAILAGLGWLFERRLDYTARNLHGQDLRALAAGCAPLERTLSTLLARRSIETVLRTKNTSGPAAQKAPAGSSDGTSP